MSNEKPKFPGGVIVYGPKRCGKTYNSDALRLALGCVSPTVDDWQPGDDFIYGALHLTNATREDMANLRLPRLPFSIAMEISGLTSLDSVGEAHTGHEIRGRITFSEPMGQPGRDFPEDSAKQTGLKPGDCVTLRSGGPLMTVLECCCTEAACAWFDEDADLRGADLPLAALKVVEGDHVPF